MKDKVVIVTGGTSGIGEATVLEFAKEGAKVIIVGRNKQKGLEVEKKVEELGGNAIFIETDVSREDDVRKMINQVVSLYNKIDILVNNAGVLSTNPITKVSEEEFYEMVNVNFKGVFLCIKHALPHIPEGGVIINVASILGHVGAPNYSIYCGTKGAVIAMTKALAWELGRRGIRVISVSPGSVETPMLINEMKTEALKRRVSIDVIKNEKKHLTALNRIAKPEEIAKVIVFLASEKASFMTGVDVIIDGGRTAI